MVAPVVGGQRVGPGARTLPEVEASRRGFPSKLNPVETVLTGDRRAETLLTSSPLNSYPVKPKNLMTYPHQDPP
ncbi:hypothetical protein [Prochlorothrix hollandica]|uniref:hypothetical protein n=1 Tax=Prochlorothrix hollandica TaxID=1223 RepID=UPI00333F0654